MVFKETRVEILFSGFQINSLNMQIEGSFERKLFFVCSKYFQDQFFSEWIANKTFFIRLKDFQDCLINPKPVLHT